MKRNEIKPESIWNERKQSELKTFVSALSKAQSKERRIKTELLAIQYRMEDYIADQSAQGEVLTLLDFVKMFLKSLAISKKQLAELFEMDDSNLHKYLTGERRLNAELVLKLSSFSHTKPEYWYYIQVKNELNELHNEKYDAAHYQKFDYRNLVSA